MKDSYESLNDLLTEAAMRLDTAARMIRDIDMTPENNIARIGEALVIIFEIQHQLYAVRPDLKPIYDH